MRLPVLFILMLTACSQQHSEPPPTTVTAESSSTAELAAKQMSASGLTVLLPEDLARQEVTGRSDVLLEDTHYAASREENDISWSLAGSVVNRAESTIDVSPGTPMATLRGVPIYVSENEGIKTATWIENGTAFAMDIECDSDKDPRCISSEYILDRVKRLVERPQQ